MKKTNREKYDCMDCQNRALINEGEPTPIDINGHTLYMHTAAPYCTLEHTEPKGENCKDFKHYLKEQKKIQLNINIKRYLKDT